MRPRSRLHTGGAGSSTCSQGLETSRAMYSTSIDGLSMYCSPLPRPAKCSLACRSNVKIHPTTWFCSMSSRTVFG